MAAAAATGFQATDGVRLVAASVKAELFVGQVRMTFVPARWIANRDGGINCVESVRPARKAEPPGLPCARPSNVIEAIVSPTKGAGSSNSWRSRRDWLDCVVGAPFKK